MALDKQRLLHVLDTLVRRAPLNAAEYASIGYFVMDDMAAPDRAILHFAKAIEAAPPEDRFAGQLAAELRASQRPDLPERIERIGLGRRSAADPAAGAGIHRASNDGRK